MNVGAHRVVKRNPQVRMPEIERREEDHEGQQGRFRVEEKPSSLAPVPTRQAELTARESRGSASAPAPARGRRLREVEMVGAGPAGGLEVGALPVARGGVEPGVKPTGLGAVAVMVVVGHEPGQVAELGRGARGAAAAAVADVRIVGPAARQASRRRPIWALDSGWKIRAAWAFSRIWSVFRIDTQTEENRSSVQIAWSKALSGRQPHGRELWKLEPDLVEVHVARDFLLHGDQPDPRL